MADDRYTSMIGPLVAGGRPFTSTVESVAAVQVERCVVLAEAMAGRLGPDWPGRRAEVIDAAGHRRPVYGPILAYAYAVAGLIAGVPPGSARLEPVAMDGPFTAAAGGQAAAGVWSALALHVGAVAMGQNDWADAARRTFDRLVESQQPSGAFLRATASDNPETHWYHELVILHAAADYGVWTGDPAITSAVERATRFHLAETEPDHATGQPWGLPAFVRVAGAEPLTDAALHAVSAHQPGGAGGVALFLLADTLYGLRHAAPRPATPKDRLP